MVRGSQGVGSGNIWLDSLHCTGSEASFSQCRHDPWGRNDCTHSEDLGIICSGGEGGGNRVGRQEEREEGRS